MSRLSLAALALTMAGSTLLAQSAKPTPQPPVEKEITVRGCLAQGSTPEIFILNNGVGETGVTGTNLRFRVVPDHDGIDLKSHLNHQVQLSGPTDGRPQPPTGKSVPDTEYPTLRARTVSMISNECVVPVTAPASGPRGDAQTSPQTPAS